MTNFIKTTQKISTCDEWYTTPGARCRTNEDCIKIRNQYNNQWHGIESILNLIFIDY